MTKKVIKNSPLSMALEESELSWVRTVRGRSPNRSFETVAEQSIPELTHKKEQFQTLSNNNLRFLLPTANNRYKCIVIFIIS